MSGIWNFRPIQAVPSAQSESWNEMFPKIIDPKELERRRLARQQLIDIYKVNLCIKRMRSYRQNLGLITWQLSI